MKILSGKLFGTRGRLLALTCIAMASGFGSRSQAQERKIKTVTVWINAFIPKDIEVAGRPDLTKPVPGSGTHAGKTMIRGPVPAVSDCFLTDQRTFSDDPRASSRMHCGLTIDVPSLKVLGKIDKRCDPTIEVDCEDGDEECRMAASTDRIEVKEFSATAGAGGAATIKFRLVGAASNACFELAPGALVPDIDWDLLVTVEIAAGGQKADITARGDKALEPFPAFEMYARTNMDDAVVVFQVPPVDGKDATSLIGKPDQPIDKTVTIGE